MGEELKKSQQPEQPGWHARVNKYAYAVIFGSGALAAAGIGAKEVVDGNLVVADPDFGAAIVFGLAAILSRA